MKSILSLFAVVFLLTSISMQFKSKEPRFEPFSYFTKDSTTVIPSKYAICQFGDFRITSRFLKATSTVHIKQSDTVEFLYEYLNKNGPTTRDLQLVKLEVVKNKRMIIYNKTSGVGNDSVAFETSNYNNSIIRITISDLPVGEYAFVCGKTPFYVCQLPKEDATRLYYPFSVVE